MIDTKIIISLVRILFYCIYGAKSWANELSFLTILWIFYGRSRKCTEQCFDILPISPTVWPSAKIVFALTAIKLIHEHWLLSFVTIALSFILTVRLLLMVFVFLARSKVVSVYCSSFLLVHRFSSPFYWNLSFFIFFRRVMV